MEIADNYKVDLDIYNGPVDLLLYLIKKDEVNIYDIPISRITEHYLHYVDALQTLDMNNIGDFLIMAATLMYIKSYMLLPKTEMKDEDEIEEAAEEEKDDVDEDDEEDEVVEEEEEDSTEEAEKEKKK